MKKPTQSKTLSWSESPEDMLDMIDEAQYSIGDAMAMLKGVGAFDEYFDELDSLYDGLESMREQYEEAAAQDAKRENDELTKDYHDDLI